jgi:C-terminal processing protease CtpA/Prc
LEQQAATREDAVVETPASRNRDRTPDANGSGNLSRMSNGTRRSTASHGQGHRPEHGGHDIKSSGIRVAYDGGCHRVEVIERGSSADLCGLIRKGDVLAKVDGRPAIDIFGMRGSARRVKGPEGSLVVLSLERDMQGMPPMPYEVELFYGTIPPERLMHVLENSTRELEQELELCRAQEELGREIGRKLCMDKDANIVLEGAGSCPVDSTPQ